MPINKSWMHVKNRASNEYFHGVEEFLDFAFANTTSSVNKIRCPCIDCNCRHWKTREEVKTDLIIRGMVPNYTTWFCHGESYRQASIVNEDDNDDGKDDRGECPDATKYGATGSNAHDTTSTTSKRKMSSTPSKCKGGRASWTLAHTTFLLDSLVEQHDLRNTTDNEFKKEVWKKVVDDFNKKFMGNINIIQAKNHLSDLKEKFRIVKAIREQSGFGWDDTLQIAIASEDVWNQYIIAQPKSKPFRRTPFPHYDSLRILCGTMAEGKRQKSTCALLKEFIVEQSLIQNTSTPNATQTHLPSSAVAPSLEPIEGSNSSSNNIVLSTRRDFKKDKHPCVPPSLPQKKKKRTSAGEKIAESISRMVASSDRLRIMSTPSSTKDPYEICLEELQTLEDLNEETMLRAIDFLQQRQNAIAFLTLKGPLRIKWLRNKCGCITNND